LCVFVIGVVVAVVPGFETVVFSMNVKREWFCAINVYLNTFALSLQSYTSSKHLKKWKQINVTKLLKN